MRNKLFWGVATAALVVPMAAMAQETTTVIKGTVTQSGTPVPNASIVVTNVPSGTRSTTTADANGGFTLTGLRPGGPYTLDVTSAQGNASVTDIYTVLQQDYTVPVDIAAGGNASTQDVVVTASSISRAGSLSNGPSTVLDQKAVSKVASVNRDIRDIERRSPFASLDPTNSRAVSFAGVNPRFNRFTINGAQVGDSFGLNPDASPTRRGPIPYDAIGQVSVQLVPFDIRQTNFQGGVIDTTIRSGTNDYFLTGFYSQSTNGLQGHRIGSVTIPDVKYKSETYGVTASGPIIKDKLFIMGSYERNTDPRPLSPGSTSGVPGLTDATVAQVQSIAKSVYGYDTGGILPITNNLDEKFVIRLDWNIMDGQRLSLSYINSYDALDSLVNSGVNATGNNTSAPTTTAGPGVSLASNDYKLTELLRTGIVQLNSDWSDTLSSEARFSYKAATRGQIPELGGGFAQFKVCAVQTATVSTTDTATSCGTGNPVLYFGPDISRQFNALFTDTYDGSFLLRKRAGDHDVKGLFQYVENRTTDEFLQYYTGAYYFDSITDLQNRNANQFDYQNALSLNPNDTNENFKYGTYSFGLQDDWRISDVLSISYGVRYDLYGSRSQVTGNPNFFNRYGFTNTNNFDGLQAFQPRFSFNYKPIPRLSLRGGVGVFSGGTPDIYFGNAYGNSGFAQNRISTVVRASTTAAGVPVCTAPYNTAANAAVCTAALTGVTGTSIPAVINTYLSTNTASLVTAPTASVASNFRLPSQTRASLSADYRFFGIDFGADYVYSQVNDAVNFTDLRSVANGVLPDGRIRYTFVRTPGAGVQTADTNTDIQIDNTGKGRSHIAVVRFDKDFDWGLSLGGSYTYQNVKDVSNATSSVATSLYNAQTGGTDPNNAAYGTSSDQIKWQFKYSVGYDHAFFGDYRTVFQLFGETRAGRPYSFTMQDITSGRSAVFGTTGNQNRYLLYVPTSTNDPKVSYDSTATQTALDNLINNTELKDFRGKISAKNIARSRANTKIDLHLEQEIPTFLGHSRISLFADIENLPNLLNSKWGGVYQVGFPQTSTTVQVQCLSVATPTGQAVANIGATAAQNPTGLPAVANTSTAQTCAQYRYSTPTSPIQSVTSTVSLYFIRVGARFTF